MYKEYNKVVVVKCLRSTAIHSWYLHEGLITLTLVDHKVSDAEKIAIANRIFILRDEIISLKYIMPYIKKTWQD